MIPFNVPFVTGKEISYIHQAIRTKKLCGDGIFTKRCSELLVCYTKTKKAMLTTSCTHALEMAAILVGIQEGDEVIMPSFTFVTTANAFVLRGAKIVFVDIRPDTMNIDEAKIEVAITNKTKAIVPVHYAGVCCEMDVIMKLAEKYNLMVIEDAAQGMMANYKGMALGSIGHIGCYSFHETKNYTCGEGGAILINDRKFLERAEVIREKGTNRLKFLNGQVDKYTWVDIGSSYLLSEINAAFLYSQLEMADRVNKKRINLWKRYYQHLKELEIKGCLELPRVPSHCEHSAHIFYIKLKDIKERQLMIEFLKDNGIQTVFHYVPLHSSLGGKRFGKFIGEDKYTTKESERLLRLPLYYGLKLKELDYIIKQVKNFINKIVFNKKCNAR